MRVLTQGLIKDTFSVNLSDRGTNKPRTVLFDKRFNDCSVLPLLRVQCT